MQATSATARNSDKMRTDMKWLLILAFCLLQNLAGMAQKQIYIPTQMKGDSEGYSETDESKMWCLKRSRQSDNCIVFWQSGYGTNDPNSTAVPSDYRVDVDDLLQKLELFYDEYVNTLKFAEVGQGKSNLDKYKFVVCLYYTKEWKAYGSGFDDVIGGMWISPSTCHPVGSTIAHEMGHSFQYQVHCDLKGAAGFRYNVGQGCAYWEQTAQWMSYMVYPQLAFTDWNFPAYPKKCNMAFLHEDIRYNSYFLHYYQIEKHGIDMVGRIWRGGTSSGQDANLVYMKVAGLSVKDFYRECYEAAAKMATWDIDRLRDYGKNYIGRHTCQFYELGDTAFQIAYASCPQSTGYNLVPLQVPAGGGEVTTVFSALPANSKLAPGDPGLCKIDKDGNPKKVIRYNSVTGYYNRGFRLGYVALLDDGRRVYQSADTVYAHSTKLSCDSIRFQVPPRTERLWFVVSPAPTAYFSHKWDEDNSNDDQWPYRLQFAGTDLLDHVNIGDPKGEIADTVFHCNVGVEPTTGSDYSGTTVTLTGALGEAVGRSLKMQPADIAGHIVKWAATQKDSAITFWALNPTTLKPANTGSTANGYGHWFSASGSAVNFGSGHRVYSEFTPATATFLIGPAPGATKRGEVYKIGQAFKYTLGGKTVYAKIIFHVYIGGVPSAIADVVRPASTRVDVYSLGGTLLRRGVQAGEATSGLPKGVYIVGGKKVVR